MSNHAQSTQPLRTVFIGNGASIYPLHEKAADPAHFELVGMADSIDVRVPKHAAGCCTARPSSPTTVCLLECGAA